MRCLARVGFPRKSFEQGERKKEVFLSMPTVFCAPEDGNLCFWFTYDTHIVDLMRKIPGRQWNAERRLWIVPKRSRNDAMRILSGVRVKEEAAVPASRAQKRAPVETAAAHAGTIGIKRAAGLLILTFDFDRNVVEAVRAVSGRWWHPVEKYWTIPQKGFAALRRQLAARNWDGRIWDQDFDREIPLAADEESFGGRGTPVQSEDESSGAAGEAEEMSEHATEVCDFEAAFRKTEIPDIDISDVHFRCGSGNVLAHQTDFMRFAKKALNDGRRGILLADEQGLGKTLEAINLAMYVKETRGVKHCLVICCVNSTVRNWADEIRMHAGEEAWVLGRRRKRDGTFSIGSSDDKLADLEWLEKAEDAFPFFIVTNVETLRMRRAAPENAARSTNRYPNMGQIRRLINGGVLGMVVVDEVHKNTSPSSVQGRALWRIGRDTTPDCLFLPMTGTPLVNRPADLFLPLGMCGAHAFRTFKAFTNYFCPGGTKVVTDFSNLPELRRALCDVMIRRRKEDALDLPEKTYITEYVTNTPYQKKLYSKIAEEIMQKLEESDLAEVPNPLAMLLRLRQVNGSPEVLPDCRGLRAEQPGYLDRNAKMKRLIEITEEILEAGEKALIFSNWSKPLDTVAHFLKQRTDIAVITGDVSPRDRQKAAERFQKDPDCGVLIGTIRAMGTGLTLTAASHVIFLDEPWTPADKMQAEDRAHRIGTKGTVCIHTLLTEDTVDERVHDIVYEKKQASDLLIDGKLSVAGDELDFRRDPVLLRHIVMGNEAGAAEPDPVLPANAHAAHS